MADQHIEEIFLYRYKLPLSAYSPLREGIILEMITGDGERLLAEASPLAGRSRESLKEVYDELKTISRQWKKKEIAALFDEVLLSSTLSSTASFALFSLGYQILKKPQNLQTHISALLLGDYMQITDQLTRLSSKGVTHVKLKTSKLSPYQAHEILQNLLEKYTVRIDCNRSWTEDETKAFFSSYGPFDFEYIEEPISREIDHSIALDESLLESDSPLQILHDQVRAIVLKPSVIGAGPKANDLIQLCRKYNKKVILSSSFETGLGLYQIALFAEHFCLEGSPLGLDTYQFLPIDLLEKRHLIENGIMHFSAPSIDINSLLGRHLWKIS